MIEQMKKVTVVCLGAERENAVQQLQTLGILHVTNMVAPASRQLDGAVKKNEALLRGIAFLEDRLKERKLTVDSTAAMSPDELVEALEKAQARRTELLALNDAARKDLELLAPWGSFDAAQLRKLETAGLFVVPCLGTKDQLADLALPEGAFLKVISEERGMQAAVVISREPLTGVALPKAVLPETTDMAALQNGIAERETTLKSLDSELDTLAKTAIPAMKAALPGIEDDVAFLQARDGMGNADQLAYIGGYVPTKCLENILQAARTAGWAIRYEEIEEDDPNVPTLLNIPKKFAMAKAIFDFVGILPGYFESDVSIAMYLFLTLFCGILIGDAGYGLILSLVSGFFLLKTKNPAARNGLKVLFSMMVCTFAFGALSGNWFGIPASKMPCPFSGLPWLSQDDTQGHIKVLCFFIGAFHTSLARGIVAWKARKSIRDVIGNLGWGLFLWGNYFAASALLVGPVVESKIPMFALYGLGFVGILIGGINWSEVGDVIYSPFAFINSFVDILSYIRLFAVGLSGVYIAASFNDMASAIWDGNPWLIPVGVIVLLLGHVLNVVMAALSILVHGVRLNTLEFSGHVGVSWGGKSYEPLKRRSACEK